MLVADKTHPSAPFPATGLMNQQVGTEPCRWRSEVCLRPADSYSVEFHWGLEDTVLEVSLSKQCRNGAHLDSPR